MTEYSKIKKDPASQGFRYVQYALDAKELSRHRIKPEAFYDRLKAETDAAIAAMVERQMRWLAEPMVYVKVPPEVRVTQGTFTIGPPAPVDPLDVEYDGVKLRILLIHDERARRERDRNLATPAQRAAISAHWSAELRAKVAASKERDRRRVVVDLEEP